MDKKTSPNKKIAPEVAKLGAYLKHLRQEMALSIHEAARKSHLTAGYLSRLENGQTFKSITIQNLIALSQTYNAPINFLLEKTGFLKKQDDLPGLNIFLKLKYDAPFSAIKEMEIAWEITKKKYSLD